MSVSELVAISKQISLQPPDRYRFYGVERVADETAPLNDEVLRGTLATFRPMLEDDLYRFAYARGGCRPSSPPISFSPAVEPNAAVRVFPEPCRLSVETVMADGSIVVSHRGVRFRLRPGAFVADFSEARGVLPGDRVRRYRPVVQADAQQAFVRISGGIAIAPYRAGALLRFYWNATYSGAKALLEAFDQAFARLRMPYLAKRLADPAHYERRDSVVLYIDRRYATVADDIISGLHRDIETELRDHVPLFTLPLARGLGFAEDPVSGASFGQERCRLFAEALEAVSSGSAFDRSLEIAFGQAGLDFDRPHRNALAHDRQGGPEWWRI